jgi:hypothetical protein
MKLDLDPKFEKAWNYANNFMYNRIKNAGHLTVFLKDPSIRAEWSDEERAFLKDSWYVITTGSCDPANKEEELSVDESRIYQDIEASVIEAEIEGDDTEVDLEIMTKWELEEYAREVHSVELDRRLSRVNMMKRLNELLS